MSIRGVTLAIIAALGLTRPALADIPLEVIARQSITSYHVPSSIEVARTPAELNALWPSISLRQPPPVVDFRTRMVVAYFMGAMPDLGSGVDIVGIQIHAGTMILQIREWQHCGGGQMPHSPAIVFTTVRWPRAIVADRRPRECN